MIEMIRSQLPAILENFPLFPPEASTMAGTVDFLYLVWAALSVFFSLLIGGATVFMMLRYHRRHENSVGAAETHAPMVEVAAIAIPFVIAMSMFVWGAKVYIDLRRPPADAVEYFAFGKQWMWKYQHPNGKRQINHLTVPVDTPIKMTMTSEDVIHAFFVPAFRIKQDVLPGRYTTVWFEATKIGDFRQYCAEYCGTDHAKMGGWVTVLSQADYEEWLRQDAPVTSILTEGEELFASLACSTCHLEGDDPKGPSLHGLFGSEVVLADGSKLIADDAYVRESILDPRAKVAAGFEPLMPTFDGQISEQQLMALVRYVKDLGPSAEEASVASTEGGATMGSDEFALTDPVEQGEDSPVGPAAGLTTGGS